MQMQVQVPTFNLDLNFIDESGKAHLMVLIPNQAVVPNINQFEQAKAQAQRIAEKLEQAGQQIKALEDRLRNPPTPDPQYCYLMRRENGHHKIGISNDVDRRHDQIRRDHPGTSLIGWFDCDDMRQAERMLHDQFAEKRQDGEWFDLSTDEVDYIVSIGRFAAGEFWQRTSPENLNKPETPTDEQVF